MVNLKPKTVLLPTGSNPLIQAKGYLLLIDEEAETCEYYLHYSIDGRHQIYPYKGNEDNFKKGQPIKWCSKIIAYYPLTKEAKELDLPLLPNPFEEEPLMKQASKLRELRGYHKDSHYSFCGGFIEGYKAAQSKQFSLEDVKKAIDLTQQICDRNAHYVQRDRKVHVPMITIDEEEEIIQSITTQRLPKEFIPEYRYYYHSSKEFYSDAGFVECSKEQYESIKAEIPTCPLKTELKTITNSEGKQELVGKYEY